MTCRVVVAGYYGAGNAGDEWILNALLGGLRRRDPTAELRILSYDPEATQREHGVETVGWGNIDALAAAVRWSSLVIVGGGGLWQDYWGFDPLALLSGRPGGIAGYGTPIVLAHLLGRPCALLGAGVGPLRSQAGRDAVRDLASIAGLVSVRDDASRNELVACGVPGERIHLGADLALLAALPAPKLPRQSGHPVLGVSLRPWAFAGESDRWQATVASAVRLWCSAKNGRVTFVPLHESLNPIEDDRRVAERVAAAVGLPERVRVTPPGLSPSDRFAALASVDIVLGMRYHSLAEALLAGIPCVGLAYDPKIRYLMDEAGAGDAVFVLQGLDETALANRLTISTSQPGVDGGGLAGLRARAEESLHRALDIADAPASHPPALLGEFVVGQSEYLVSLEQVLREHFHLPVSSEGRAQAGLAAIEGAAVQLSRAGREVLQVRRELEQVRRESVQAHDDLSQALVAKATAEDRLQDAERVLATQRLDLESERARAVEVNRQLAVLRATKGVRLLGFCWRLLAALRRALRSTSPTLEALGRAAHRVVDSPFSRALFVVRRGIELPPSLPPVFLYTSRDDLFPNYPLRRRLQPSHRKAGVSLVVTVRDEGSSAPAWFESILSQVRLPDEIVIVDNGSVDSTKVLLARFADDSPVPVNIIDAPGTSVAGCRNLGVESARYSILAFTDFGCAPDTVWLENLIAPFDDDAISVSVGWYEARAPSTRHRILASDLVPTLDEVGPMTFLPATRSLAVRRELLAQAGGFPGWLSYAGEDTFVGMSMKRAAAAWAFVPEARVLWEPPSSLAAYWKKLVRWSRGDGESGVYAKHYWARTVRWLGSLALGVFGLVAGVVGAASGAGTITLLGVATAVVCVLAALGLVGRRGESKAPVLLRVAGQAARTVGFLQGLGDRPEVTARRYADVQRVVLLLATVPWDDTGGGSRGAQIAAEFVRRGDLVVYVYRFPKQESVELHLPLPRGNTIELPLEHFDWQAFAWEFAALLRERTLLAIVECPDKGFLPIIRRWKEAGGTVVYDLIDDWTTSLGGTWFSDGVESAIVGEADVLTASAAGLAKRLQGEYGREPLMLPNGVNLDLFNPEIHYPRPDDLPSGRFVALYVGALWGQWFDWELVLACARAFPDAAFVLIGDYRGQCGSPEPNMHFLGLKAQTELPPYLAHADVALVPWKVSPITRATSPLKVYEYLAMGLPVVAPDLETLRGMPLVHRQASEAAFVRAVRTIRRGPDGRKAAREFIAQSSWRVRVETLLTHLARRARDRSE